MAIYTDLLIASENPTLNLKIRVACFIAAETVRNEVVTTPNHANRLLWAKNVFLNPGQESQRMLWAVLAQNKSFTLAQITGASDAQVQTAVDACVDIFAN